MGDVYAKRTGTGGASSAVREAIQQINIILSGTDLFLRLRDVRSKKVSKKTPDEQRHDRGEATAAGRDRSSDLLALQLREPLV
ncbi:hypothetical protein EVAR_95116_1 [Eumeta japonica]|uniref:Uncharacterized protein n=1 Tax=Eumeta variegata TaxID=151549 RepID=A0A4C1W4F7_EUMVA|nr:hypothetical protein EVAR_95116_1 [Eumeta japonica]